MATRKTLAERCKSTLKSMKARARKDGDEIHFTVEDLLTRVPEHCIWCRKRLTPAIINFDHLKPLARGGDWSLDNILAICASDNRRKGTLTDIEYRLLLRKLDELTDALGDDYLKKNVLKRLSAGAAWIHS
jgi:hypothetical protein